LGTRAELISLVKVPVTTVVSQTLKRRPFVSFEAILQKKLKSVLNVIPPLELY
jgi:hypothetical protein